MARPYDVVVFGASGFTGRLVCEQLLSRYSGGSVKWAMAGRSRDKLEQTKVTLKELGCAGVEDIPMLVADTDDPASLDAMTSQATTVISTVGPYTYYGTPLVESSLKNSTHYCDLTGEVPWVRRNIKAYHAEAEEKGVKLVHCCGFDSVPFDLGVHMVAKEMEAQGKKLDYVSTLMGKSLGGVSGGTIASGFAMSGYPADEFKAMSDPYCLCPPESRGEDKDESWWWGYNKDLKKHTYPFIMAGCNTRVVRRSNALLGQAYGSNFKYTEECEAPGIVSAVAGAAAMAAAKSMMGLPFLQPLLKKVLPSPGEGPSRELQMKGYWNVTLVGKSEDGSRAIMGKVGGKNDPGYYDTARMLLECALALSLQGADLQAAGYLKGGVLTPASAVGMVGVQRLRDAGLQFETEPLE